VLLIEDDGSCASLIHDLLAREGYDVAIARDAAQAHAMLPQLQPDLVLLDIVLPDADGLVLYTQLRSRWPAPFIFVSGTRRRMDSILSLKLGAEDFIAKPFDVQEFVARVEAVLRRARAAHPSAPTQHLGDLVIDRGRLIVECGGQTLPLTPTEFRLLGALATRPNAVLSRGDLAEAVWGSAHVGQSRAVDVHVRRLRQKLHGLRNRAPRISTVRGMGYRLVPPSGGAAA
jgi:two-component system response regulator VicR